MQNFISKQKSQRTNENKYIENKIKSKKKAQTNYQYLNKQNEILHTSIYSHDLTFGQNKYLNESKVIPQSMQLKNYWEQFKQMGHGRLILSVQTQDCSNQNQILNQSLFSSLHSLKQSKNIETNIHNKEYYFCSGKKNNFLNMQQLSSIKKSHFLLFQSSNSGYSDSFNKENFVQNNDFKQDSQSIFQKQTHQILTKQYEYSLKKLKNNKKQFFIQNFIKIKLITTTDISSIFMVFHKKTNFICNLRIIDKETIKGQGLQNQLCRSFRASLRLRNSVGISQIYGIFQDKNNIYCLTEYCGELIEQVKSVQLLKTQSKESNMLCTEAKAALLLRPLVQTIRLLHSEGYIMRAMSFFSLTYCFSTIKILHFDSCAHAQSGARNTFCGSILTAPPQIINGETCNTSADIWGLGIIIYKMVVGKNPFQKINNASQITKRKQLSIPLNVSIEFADLILKTITNQNQRCSIDQLLFHSFFKVENENIAREIWKFWLK